MSLYCYKYTTEEHHVSFDETVVDMIISTCGSLGVQHTHRSNRARRRQRSPKELLLVCSAPRWWRIVCVVPSTIVASRPRSRHTHRLDTIRRTDGEGEWVKPLEQRYTAVTAGPQGGARGQVTGKQSCEAFSSPASPSISPRVAAWRRIACRGYTGASTHYRGVDSGSSSTGVQRVKRERVGGGFGPRHFGAGCLDRA